MKAAFPAPSVAVPNEVAPSFKVTGPVGVPTVEDVTVTVNVTVWPPEDGFAEEIRIVEVAALFTVWDKAEEVLGL